MLSSTDKRSLKRKHRREQLRAANKKENKRSNKTTVKTYDRYVKISRIDRCMMTSFFSRSDPADIVRFFAPMRTKISSLYDDLQTATCNGNLRQVLKIEEKLKLLK